MSGWDQMLIYLQCIVFVSDLVFNCDIGNNNCCSFRTRCCIWLVRSFLNWYRVIFPVTLKFQWVQVLHCPFQIDFPSLSRTARTTPSLPRISFSTSPSFHKFLWSHFLISTSPTLTCCSFHKLLCVFHVRPWVSTWTKLLFYTSW